MKNFIIDTDCGIDDTTAILLALSSNQCKVHAISLCDGNIPIPDSIKAISHILTFTNNHIDVYVGSLYPILKKPVPKWPGHESCLDGFGIQRETTIVPKKEVAANALVRLVNSDPGFYTIVALGPLTNIAIALLLDPLFLTKVDLICMGGTINSRGNSSKSSEFNFHYDPEAVDIVLRSPTKTLVTFVPWETTVYSSFSWEFRDHLVSLEGKCSKFLESYTRIAVFLMREKYDSFTTCTEINLYWKQSNGFLMCDLYAMAVAIEESVIQEYHDFDCEIYLNGNSRGTLSYNWWPEGESPRARVILKLDRDKIQRMLEESILFHNKSS